MRKILIIILLLPIFSFSQDINYAKKIIDTLASPALFGRGYAIDGHNMAAKFISDELQRLHLKSKTKDYYQEFTLNANIFPSRMEVSFNGNRLIPGVDYIVNPTSGTSRGTFKVQYLTVDIIDDEKKYTKFKTQDLSETFVVIDTIGVTNASFKNDYEEIIDDNTLKAAGLITITDNLVFGAGRYQNDFMHLIVLRSSLPEKLKTVETLIDAQFLSKHKTQNIFGYIEGEVDTFIIFTAHYDHLGTMGRNVIFPGAHDNASGCAFLLDLAKEYSQRKSIPHYSIGFIFFSGEEIGLVGSYNFVQNPLIPLSNIKFLLNLDLMGSGEEGIQIVNSTVYEKEYQKLLEINEEHNLLPQIKKRGPAANSDHYYFYEKGVPSFFIYTLGSYKEYHNIRDTRENIPLSGYESVFKLLMFFVDDMNK